MNTERTIILYRCLKDGSRFNLGAAVRNAEGWRFIPHIAARRSSRKAHPTFQKCVPRWVGFPLRCKSEEVSR